MHTCKSSKEQILHCEPRWDFLRCFYLFKTLWVYHKQVLLLRNAFSPRIVKVYSSRWGCNRCRADLGNWVASPISGNAGFSLFKEFERIWYFEWSNYIFIKSSRKFFHILLFFGGYDWIYLLLRYFLKRDNFYISDFYFLLSSISFLSWVIFSDKKNENSNFYWEKLLGGNDYLLYPRPNTGIKRVIFSLLLKSGGLCFYFWNPTTKMLEFIRTRFHVVLLLCLKNYRIIASWITKQYKAFSANDPQIQGCSWILRNLRVSDKFSNIW